MLSNEKIFYVYVWYVKDTNEIFYVGKGKDKRYKSVSKRNKFFTDMLKTHDCEVCKVYEDLSEKEAFELEKELIFQIKKYTNDRLTNQTDGGEGVSGLTVSDETKQKMSSASIKKWNDSNFREKMIEIRNDPNGVYKSAEFKNKISSLVKKENNPNYGNYWSEEQKRELSYKKIGKNLLSENPNSKMIICIETGEIFDCIESAKRKYNVKNISSFSIALKDDVRTAAGLHWQKYTDELSDREYRTKKLIDVLSRSQNKSSLICLETNEIFFKQKDLLDRLNLSVKKFKKLLNNGVLKYKNYSYMFLRNYTNCPAYQ